VSGNSRKIMVQSSPRTIQGLQTPTPTSNDYTVPTSDCPSIQWTQYRVPIVSSQDAGRTANGDKKFLEDIECSSFSGSNTTTPSRILLRQFPTRKSTHKLKERSFDVYDP